MKDELNAPNQTEKFKELARELAEDEDEAGFDEKLRRVGTAPKSPAKPNDTE